jgi:hypothetical protein
MERPQRRDPDAGSSGMASSAPKLTQTAIASKERSSRGLTRSPAAGVSESPVAVCIKDFHRRDLISGPHASSPPSPSLLDCNSAEEGLYDGLNSARDKVHGLGASSASE